MSQNVARFHESVEAVNRGDWDAVIALMDPEIVFIPQRAPVQGNYLGHAGVREFVRDTQETFDVFQGDYPDVRDLGDDRILAIGTLRIRGIESGIETAVPSAIVLTFRDGLMVHFHAFSDPRPALGAAGLSESDD